MSDKCFNDFVHEDQNLGQVISGDSVCTPVLKSTRLLKYYSVTEETRAIIAHNLKWAKTGQGAPRFQFIYLMLPTPCNQQCQGCFTKQDKSRLPVLNGPYWSLKKLDSILEVAKDHKTKAVVYGGGGELFTWPGAFRFIERIVGQGLGMVIFTNGSLLLPADIARLNDLGVVLIVSLRDTAEVKHNALVGQPNWRRSICTIEECLKLGMNKDGRLAIEMPVTYDNEERVLNDLLPVCRALGIVPWIEEFIQISASKKQRAGCHTFKQARNFFKRMSIKDAKLGVNWTPRYGQRMVDQPQCRRALYSFAVFPNEDVFDCPGHFRWYGNMRQTPLGKIICSEKFKQAQLAFEYCPCSVFYTAQRSDIPRVLPTYLEENTEER